MDVFSELEKNGLRRKILKKGEQKLQVKLGAKVRGVNGGKLGVKTFGDNNSGEKLGAKRGGNHKLL